MPLTLSLAGISVTLNKFVSNEYPRILIQQLSSVEYSAYGSVALQGSHFEPKYMWSFQALCDKEQRLLLEAIAFEFQTRRRALEDSDILLYDTTAPIVERLPRTRVIVPNTTETVINGGTHVAYLAAFRCAITDGPKPSQNGRLDVLQLVLVETIKVSA